MPPCIDACPTDALDEPGTLDATKCLSYWTQAPAAIPEDYREHLGAQVYGCDICQDVCPWNAASRSATPATHPRRRTSSLVDWLCMDDELRRRGTTVSTSPRNDGRWLKRNALVAAGNVGGGKRNALAVEELRGRRATSCCVSTPRGRSERLAG